MISDSTTRLLQILRTTLELIKYYEGHPASAGLIGDLKGNLRRTIDELVTIDAAERASERGDSLDMRGTLDSIERADR